MLKKNTRVKLGDKLGTVVGNSYRCFESGKWDSYCEVYFDEFEYIETVEVNKLETIG